MVVNTVCDIAYLKNTNMVQVQQQSFQMEVIYLKSHVCQTIFTHFPLSLSLHLKHIDLFI